MAGFLTTHVNNLVLDSFFGGRLCESPPELYVGLSLAKAYRGGFVLEPAGGSYARVPVPNDLAHFPDAVGGTKTNALPIAFPSPAADWGPIKSVFIATQATGGFVLACADLPSAIPMNRGDPAPTIAANALFLSHA